MDASAGEKIVQLGSYAADGCWDWWGYSSKDAKSLFYSRDAVQIKAIHAMLDRLCA
ncbi:hypothetical protein [Burkholderia sp. LMU1-1-1.1]|uniref:hypothetical protein n=1 Tax=Burkholderia sp. LMU1-1-1.1 TaxID=3135266 RepID=UPI0034218610